MATAILTLSSPRDGIRQSSIDAAERRQGRLRRVGPRPRCGSQLHRCPRRHRGDGDLDVSRATTRPTGNSSTSMMEGDVQRRRDWGPPLWSTRNAAVADLNGNGRIDVIAANRPAPATYVSTTGKDTSHRLHRDSRGSATSIYLPTSTRTASSTSPCRAATKVKAASTSPTARRALEDDPVRSRGRGRTGRRRGRFDGNGRSIWPSAMRRLRRSSCT